MAAIMLLMPFSLWAQFNLQGTISDANTATPLPGAHLTLIKQNKTTATSTDGTFIFEGLSQGKHRLKVSYLGYETQFATVNIQRNTTLDIALKQTAIMEDAVTITATRAGEKTPVAHQEISREHIQKMNLGKDIPYLLSSTPSVTVSSDGGSGVGYTSMRIRGTDLSRINVTVNGIPLNDAESHSVYFVDMPDIASSIDNLQIQRGVGTSTNGAAAFGASLNFQTQTLKAKAYADITSGYGSFNTYKNNISMGTGLLNGHWTFDGRLSKLTTDGFIDRAEADLDSYFLSGGYYSDKTIIRANVFSGHEVTYQAWDGVPSDILKTDRTFNGIGLITDKEGNISYYDNEIDDYTQDHYQLLLNHQVSPRIQLNGGLHYTRGYGYYEQYKDDTKYSKYGIESPIYGTDTIKTTDLIRRKFLDNDFYGFTASAIYHYGSSEITLGGGWNEYDGEHYGRVIWAENGGIESNDREYYNNTGLKRDYNTYLKITQELFSGLSLYGDIQYRDIRHKMKGMDDNNRNLDQTRTFSFINPKAGIHYSINDYNNVYASFAVANREPTRRTYTDADPSQPAPVFETLNDWETGYQLRTSRINIEANLFYMDYNNQLVHTGKINDVGDPIMSNIKDTYRAGIELAAGYKPNQYFQWQGNLTYSQNKAKNYIEYVDDWTTWTQRIDTLGTTNLAFSPEWIANNIITVTPLNDLSVSLISKFVSDQYIDNTSKTESKLNSYLTHDIRVNYTFKTKWISSIDCYAQVNNLLSEEYENNAWVYYYYSENIHKRMDGYFPQAGINFMTGITLHFL